MNFQGACWLILALIEEVGWSGVLWPFLVQKMALKNQINRQNDGKQTNQRTKTNTDSKPRTPDEREAENHIEPLAMKREKTKHRTIPNRTKEIELTPPMSEISFAEISPFTSLASSDGFASSKPHSYSSFYSSSSIPSWFRGWFSFPLPSSFLLFRSTLICGVIWCSWHWLFVVLGGFGFLPSTAVYHAGTRSTPLLYAFLMFSLSTISARFLMCRILQLSQTMWTSVLFHATHNSLVYSFFTQIPKFNIRETENTEETPIEEIANYMVGESGIWIALVYSIGAAFCVWGWKKEGETKRNNRKSLEERDGKQDYQHCHHHHHQPQHHEPIDQEEN